MDWQPIETCPEGVLVLVSAAWDEGEPVRCQSYRWTDRIEEEVESESTNSVGRRKIVQERRRRVREWGDQCDYEWWMPIPAPPPEH